MYEVFLADRRVEKELEDLPTFIKGRVEKALLDLEADPRPQGSRMLLGHVRGSHRLRAGDWRILYDIDDEDREVFITAIRQRREVYR